MKNFRLLICVALTAVIALGLLFTPGTVRSDAYDSGSVDISGFTQFHDENAPRVTDRAGILSSSYESRITAEIAIAAMPFPFAYQHIYAIIGDTKDSTTHIII